MDFKVNLGPVVGLELAVGNLSHICEITPYCESWILFQDQLAFYVFGTCKFISILFLWHLHIPDPGQNYAYVSFIFLYTGQTNRCLWTSNIIHPVFKLAEVTVISVIQQS